MWLVLFTLASRVDLDDLLPCISSATETCFHLQPNTRTLDIETNEKHRNIQGMSRQCHVLVDHSLHSHDACVYRELERIPRALRPRQVPGRPMTPLKRLYLALTWALASVLARYYQSLDPSSRDLSSFQLLMVRGPMYLRWSTQGTRNPVLTHTSWYDLISA